MVKIPMLKNIISLYYWTIGFLFFIFAFVSIVLSLFVFSREKTGKITRFLFQIQAWLMGIKLKVNGEDKIIKHKSYLIMGNHQSLFDIFVVPAAIPLCFTGIEAARHFSYPFWGYIIRKWGCIPITRNNLDSAKKSLNLAQKTLENGMSIAVMPEGHRTITGKMATFKKGPFHLAKAAKADILPFGIHGLYEFNKKGVFKIQPGIVTVSFGEPFAYDDFKDDSVDKIRDKVFVKIQELSK